MPSVKATTRQTHSTAWVIQSWASFIISLTGTSLGIFFLPVDFWIKSYMGMGLIFTVGSTMTLTKTIRDEHEAKQFAARIDEARVEKLLVEHHPLK